MKAFGAKPDVAGCANAGRREREREVEDEASANGRTHLQKRTPLEADEALGHLIPHFKPLRDEWRPGSADSTASANVACHRGIDVRVARLHVPASSAAADMICPDWQ